MTKTNYLYPPVSFCFNVVFLGDNLDKDAVETRFQSVTGLNVELQTESLIEGGENRFVHELPTRAKYSPLVLKRGIVKNSKMIKWCMDAIQHLEIKPMGLNINLLSIKDGSGQNSQVEPLMTWKVINAYPRKWSISEFDAEKSSLAIETLELNYHYFEYLK